jgi:hypothetical protein
MKIFFNEKNKASQKKAELGLSNSTEINFSKKLKFLAIGQEQHSN